MNHATTIWWRLCLIRIKLESECGFSWSDRDRVEEIASGYLHVLVGRSHGCSSPTWRSHHDIDQTMWDRIRVSDACNKWEHFDILSWVQTPLSRNEMFQEGASLHTSEDSRWFWSDCAADASTVGLGPWVLGGLPEWIQIRAWVQTSNMSLPSIGIKSGLKRPFSAHGSSR